MTRIALGIPKKCHLGDELEGSIYLALDAEGKTNEYRTERIRMHEKIPAWENLGVFFIRIRDAASLVLEKSDSAQLGAFVLKRFLPDQPNVNYAYAAIVDRSGNVAGGSFPDPNFFLVRGERRCIGRFFTASHLEGRSDVITQARHFIPAYEEEAARTAVEHPEMMALYGAVRTLVAPRKIVSEQWPEL